MGIFQANYNKPGKGVDENAPQKRSFFRFWELYGRKLGKLAKVNLIYAVALIPTFVVGIFLTGIITSSVLSSDMMQKTLIDMSAQFSESMKIPASELMEKLCVILDATGRVALTYLYAALWGMGPATAGATIVWRNFSREEHAWLWSDFKDSFLGNFKQSIAVFLIDVVVFLLLTIAIRVYASATGFVKALQYLIWIVAIIYTMMHFYLYPMMITFELKLKDLFKNALIFAIGKLPSNLLVLVCIIAVHLVPAYFLTVFIGEYFVAYVVAMVLVESLVLLSFSGFLVNFNATYKINKYMMDKIDESDEE